MKHKTQGWKTAKLRGQKKNRVPPFAPSKNELNFYQNYINKISKDKNFPQRALILGATPELRDGAIKAGLESYAVDISKEMMDKFSILMKHRNHSKDKRIIKDWLKIDFPEDYFGIIMGDASFINLATKKNNERLIKICAKILIKGGYLVLRQVVYPEKFKNYSDYNKLIKDYRGRKVSWEDFFMELRVMIFKEKVFNKKTFQYSAEKCFKIIDGLIRKKKLTEQEYFKINTFRNNLINIFYPEEEFIKMVGKENFRLVSVLKDKPFRFFQYLYMMVFKKN